MSEIIITTTPERLQAARAELETAYMGGEKGRLLSARGTGIYLMGGSPSSR